jgi:hypothetical protein
MTGVDTFAASFKTNRKLLVGGDGIPVAEFLARPVSSWVRG